MISQLIKKIEDSGVFKEWRKENREYYLVHAFLMIDPSIKQEWQIGYYSKKKDKIVTFCVNENITKNPEEEVFKKSGIVKKLDLKKVKIPYEKALNIAERFQKEHYPAHKTEKKIIILQNLNEELWNLTFISKAFSTLNMKISAENGKIISHNLTNLFSLDKNNKTIKE